MGIRAGRRCCQARSVALVGASPRPGTFGQRMVEEVTRSPSQAPGPPRQPAVRRDRRAPVPARRWPTCPSRSTWSCWPCPTARSRTQLDAGRRAAATASAVIFGNAHEPAAQVPAAAAAGPAGRDRAVAPGWRCAARAAWASSTSAAACAPSATPRPARCPPGRWRWSPTPARCSPRCCGPAAGCASRWPCPPARSWSPPPRPTWSTRSTCPRPGCWRWCWRPCATPASCAPCWPPPPSGTSRSCC